LPGIIFLIGIVFLLLSPIIATMIKLAVSRKREYLADASAVRYTRYPEGLASALEKISDTSSDLKTANKVTAPMYIVNPLKPKGRKLSNLSSTHPPITERVRILRSMSGGANYVDYQSAFNKIKKSNSPVIPSSGLSDNSKIGIREAIAAPAAMGLTGSTKAKQTKRKTGDIMMKANDYTFINCKCGLKIKIPPDYKKDSLFCPRCGRHHPVNS
jgi:heat shock protein HtpX